MGEQFNDHVLLREVEPAIAAAYDRHMHPTPTRTPQPIPAVATLATLAQRSVDADIRTQGETDPLIYGPSLRASLERHLTSFKVEQGVDAVATLTDTFLMNLLTEDNLPYYSVENDKIAIHSEPMTLWLREWIAEEDSHGVIMRDYALLTRLIGDPELISHDTYQEGRVSQLRNGMDIRLTSLAQAGVYLTTQELATYYAHLNLGYLLDKSGKKMMRRISGQEYNHYEFYFSLVEQLLAADRDRTMVAIRDQFKDFEMPGRIGIPDYARLSARIAVAGIFDPETVAAIQARLVKDWKVAEIRCKTDEARTAQQDLVDPQSRQNRVNRRIAGIVLRNRDKAIEEAKASGKLLPFILGRTVQVKQPLKGDVSPESRTAKDLLGA